MSATHGVECKVTKGHCYREGCDGGACAALKLARALYGLTKGSDLGDLADYDDELASDVREARSDAHEILFGVPYSEPPSQGGGQ